LELLVAAKWASQLQTRSSAWVFIFGEGGRAEAQRLSLTPTFMDWVSRIISLYLDLPSFRYIFRPEV